MTLTTLSSKEFSALYRWSLKRSRILAIVYSIILVVIGPIADMYIIASAKDYSIDLGDMLMTSVMLFALVTALFVFISAILNFMFLHNKRSVDMYGALPTNRTTMFLAHLMSGITTIGVPYIVIMIVTMGVTVRSADSFKLGLLSILSTVIMIIASYIFTALIAYCCGTIADTIIVTIAINAIWIFMVLIYHGALSSLIPGMNMYSIFNSPALTLFAPYGFGVMNTFLYFAENTSVFVISIVWSLLYTVGVFFLTLFVANKRKSECSQSGFAVAWLPMVIKAGSSIVVGFVAGLIFAEISDGGYSNMFIYVFWNVIASFVTFTILHVIFNRGIKGKILPSVIVYIATTAAAIGFVFALSFGCGIDTYVPSPDSIKSVYVCNVTFTEPENIKIATEIHQVIADGIRKDEDYPYYFGYDSNIYDYEYGTYDFPGDYPYVAYCNYDFSYKKRFGFSVNREYYVYPDTARCMAYDVAKLNELTKQLLNSDEYKIKSQYYLWDESIIANNVVTSVELNQYQFNESNDSYDSVEYAEIKADTEFTDGLYEALRKDILADNEYIESRGLGDFGNGYLEISVHGHERPKYGSATSGEYEFFFVIVKESYKNTLEYLAKANVTMTPNIAYDDFYDLEDYYYNSGDSSYLSQYISRNLYSWSQQICNSYNIDFNEWYKDNFEKFQDDVMQKTDEIIAEYYETSTDDYDEDYYDKAQYVLAEISEYIVDYIGKESNVDDSKSSDTDNVSSAESKNESATESKTESKAESATDSENKSNSENIVPDTVAKAA